MFDSLIQSVEASFEKLTVGRLLYLVFLVGLAAVAFYIYNETTAFGPYARLEKRISALERLQTLEQKGINKSPYLGPIYRRTLNALEPGGSATTHHVFDWEPLVKILAAAGIPLAFALTGLIQVLRGKSDSGSLLGGALGAAALLGVPSLFVPPLFGSLAFTIALLIVIQIAFMRWISARAKRTKAA